MTKKATKTREKTKRKNDAKRKDVQIEVVSKDLLSTMASMEKIRFILDKVKEGKIVILEAGLTPEEKMKLTEVTMTEITPDDFSGFESGGFPSSQRPNLLSRLLGRKITETRLTVIGPADQIKSLDMDRDFISVSISARS
jgi:hypothetical protein